MSKLPDSSGEESLVNSQSDVTILVSSTDSYEDCWNPFFTLLTKYWPSCPYPILLCAETKNFVFPGCNMRTVRIARPEDGGQRPEWGTCLHRTLAEVESEFVLLLWDDFFLSAAVNQPSIDRCVKEMKENRKILHITLANHDVTRRSRPWTKEFLHEVLPRSPYRISAGPGLWRKETLLKYILPDESGWHFEIFGTLRSYTRPHEIILRINENALPEVDKDVIPYFGTEEIDTAIVKGKWVPAVIPFLARNGVTVNFEKRGFYIAPSTFSRRVAMARTLFRKPHMLTRWLSLLLQARLGRKAA